MSRELPAYGMLAEFRSQGEILQAATAAHAAGFRKMDAYTPLPVHGLAEAMGFKRTWLPLIVLTGGLLGALGGYGLQYWTTVIEYPLNIGGRPLHSWPAFIPITFETTVLAAALAAVLGMLALNGLPMPYHPVFNVNRFKLATRNRFFLCIEAGDPLYDREKTRDFLEGLGAHGVHEVES